MTRETLENLPHERWPGINWQIRFDLYVMNPLRKLSGQKTSSELIAEALNKGVDRKKLDALIEEMEAFVCEQERHDNVRADQALSNTEKLPSEEVR